MTSHSPPSVAVTIVTYNSGRFIRRCLEFLLKQDYQHVEVIVVDNASTDHTTQILGDYEKRVHVIRNRENVGFAAAQNQAIAVSNSEWVLTLNPDVQVTSKFIAALVAAGIADPSAGSVCGKLLGMSSEFRDRPRRRFSIPRVCTSLPICGISIVEAESRMPASMRTSNMSLARRAPRRSIDGR